MENQTETNTVIINNMEPEQDVIIEGNKEELPKYTLPRGERLYLSKEQISDLNQSYFLMLSELKAGAAQAPPELRSVMESVVYLSYGEEIENLRLKNQREFEVERARQKRLNAALTPCTWRNWWWIFKVHRNSAQMLLDERVRREAAIELKRQADELPIVEGEEEEEMQDRELLPFEVVIETLKENLPLMRRKRREWLYELIEKLYNLYESKIDECRRLAAELEEAKRAREEAEERAQTTAETLDEFLKESKPAPDETATAEEKPAEEPKTPENAEETEAEPAEEDEEAPETEETEEETDEPADEEENDGFDYGGLDEEDEQE